MEAPFLEETLYSETSLCLSILQDRILTLLIFPGHEILKVKGKSYIFISIRARSQDSSLSFT